MYSLIYFLPQPCMEGAKRISVFIVRMIKLVTQLVIVRASLLKAILKVLRYMYLPLPHMASYGKVSLL